MNDTLLSVSELLNVVLMDEAPILVGWSAVSLMAFLKEPFNVVYPVVISTPAANVCLKMHH